MQEIHLSLPAIYGGEKKLIESNSFDLSGITGLIGPNGCGKSCLLEEARSLAQSLGLKVGYLPQWGIPLEDELVCDLLGLRRQYDLVRRLEEGTPQVGDLEASRDHVVLLTHKTLI